MYVCIYIYIYIYMCCRYIELWKVYMHIYIYISDYTSTNTFITHSCIIGHLPLPAGSVNSTERQLNNSEQNNNTKQ